VLPSRLETIQINDEREQLEDDPVVRDRAIVLHPGVRALEPDLVKKLVGGLGEPSIPHIECGVACGAVPERLHEKG
jgi:hypothetical protein